MSKKKLQNRPKARLPKGLTDTGAEEIRAMQEMLGRIREVYESYGFEPLETPAFEYTDALGKFLPDQDRPGEGVFSFQDEDEQWLSLRYDLTAPLARYVAQNFQELPKPFRRYQVGSVWRNEKPGPGRFREFLQFDADTVGAASVAADAEMCMLAADALEAVGIPRGAYVIKVNNRKVLDGWRDAFGLSDKKRDAQWLTVLRALDKYDRLGRDNVGLLLGPGRKDESGDFTEGARLKEAAIFRLLQMLSFRLHVDFQAGTVGALYNPRISTGTPDELIPRTLTSTIMSIARHYVETEEKRDIREIAVLEEGLQELEQMGGQIAAAGYDDGRIIIDPSVVRGLEYYTGPVFEAELTFEVKSREGGRFGSVGGGGRYDDLVARFTGQKVPATGFSIGVSRLAAALQALGKLEEGVGAGPVVVTVFNKDFTADSQKLVSELRNAGIRAEMFLGNPKNMGGQFKYADQRNSPCVVIQGPDEKARGEVQIKDLIEGARLSAEIADNVEWRESRPAQFAVPEDKLVEAVRDVLARHKR